MLGECVDWEEHVLLVYFGNLNVLVLGWDLACHKYMILVMVLRRVVLERPRLVIIAKFFIFSVVFDIVSSRKRKHFLLLIFGASIRLFLSKASLKHRVNLPDRFKIELYLFTVLPLINSIDRLVSLSLKRAIQSLLWACVEKIYRISQSCIVQESWPHVALFGSQGLQKGFFAQGIPVIFILQGNLGEIMIGVFD